MKQYFDVVQIVESIQNQYAMFIQNIRTNINININNITDYLKLLKNNKTELEGLYRKKINNDITLTYIKPSLYKKYENTYNLYKNTANEFLKLSREIMKKIIRTAMRNSTQISLNKLSNRVRTSFG